MATSTPSSPARAARVRPPLIASAPLGSPLFLLNLKSYPGCVGDGALRLGQLLQRVGGESRVAVAVAPAPADLALLARSLTIPVLAQHTDPLPPGARTGFLVPEAAVASGVRGSLVNHSEHPLAYDVVGATVSRLSDAGLVPVVCARDAADAARLGAYRPPYLAVEPPELIGGDRAVSTAAPEVVSDSVAAVRRVSAGTRVLCGAGIHDRRDVQASIALGAQGVLVASAVTRAADPSAALWELLAGFPRGLPGPRN
jgi:triosephosphate isomerase